MISDSIAVLRFPFHCACFRRLSRRHLHCQSAGNRRQKVSSCFRAENNCNRVASGCVCAIFWYFRLNPAKNVNVPRLMRVATNLVRFYVKTANAFVAFRSMNFKFSISDQLWVFLLLSLLFLFVFLQNWRRHVNVTPSSIDSFCAHKSEPLSRDAPLLKFLPKVPTILIMR